MALFGPATILTEGQAQAVLDLASRAHHELGHSSVGDKHWRDVYTRDDGRFAAAWATEPARPDVVVAYTQLTRDHADHAWAAELIVDPAHASASVDLGAPLIMRVLSAAAENGGGHVHFWATAATAAHAEIAARVGLEPHRVLHQMRRPLPAPTPEPIQLRPFEVGRDELDVLEVNAAAFASHPDQGSMTRQMLDARIAQPWFNAHGFLLHHAEIDGERRLGGFCWTKLFGDITPILGEIHVICVHPDFGGRGLGTALVLSGLQELHRQGAEVAVLFVEGGNEAALDLYRSLGFEITRTDRAYATTV